MIKRVEPIIKVINLSKTFKVKQKPAGFFGGLTTLLKPSYKEVTAVDRVNLSVCPGEIVAFIGPNGAGKSTTIKMLTGILYPTSGDISVLGFNPQEQRQQLAFHIGSVFGQKPQLWYHLPAQDTFNLFSKIYELDQKSYQNRLSYLVEILEIKDLLSTPVRKLSLGQRMRCEIVASLLHQPKIIFLDEPTIGLDVIAKRQIREVIKTLNEQEGVTIFLTSHDAGDIEALAQRAIVINHGKLIFDNTTDQLKKRYIKSKIIELVTENQTKDFKFNGGKIIEQSRYAVKVELDTKISSVEKLLNYAVKNYDIKDINIYDPSMEEIIAAIYEDKNI